MAQSLLVTTARLSRNTLYVGCLYFVWLAHDCYGHSGRLVTRWFSWRRGFSSLAAGMLMCGWGWSAHTGCRSQLELLQTHWYAGLVPWSGSHIGGVLVLARVTHWGEQSEKRFKGASGARWIDQGWSSGTPGQGSQCLLGRKTE